MNIFYEYLNVLRFWICSLKNIFNQNMYEITFHKIQYRIQICRTQGTVHFATQQGAGCTWPINWRLAAKYFVSQLFLPCLWQSCILRPDAGFLQMNFRHYTIMSYGKNKVLNEMWFHFLIPRCSTTAANF